MSLLVSPLIVPKRDDFGLIAVFSLGKVQFIDPQSVRKSLFRSIFTLMNGSVREWRNNNSDDRGENILTETRPRIISVLSERIKTKA